MSRPLMEVARLTKLRDRRREAAKQAERDLADGIRAALEMGESTAMLAYTTGMSRARIYQIRDGRR